MKRMRVLGMAMAAMIPATITCAQTTLEAPLGEIQEYFVDSGLKTNANNQPGMVHQEVVRIPDSAWLRLYFGDVQLDRGSYLRVTSFLDNEVQILDRQTLMMWRYSTAYFNGDSVLVELIAGPGTDNNRLVIHDIGVHIGGGVDRGGCGICGFDDRVPSSVNSAGRLMPVGCSATIYNEDSCIVTAGHCLDGGSADVLQFNVPSSQSNCNPVNPPVADQFPVLAQAFANGGVGNDWGVATIGTNNLGQQPFDRYGLLRPIAGSPSSTGQTANIWGYGVDTQCNRSQTQQFHSGPIVGVFGGYYAFSIEATFGNSGSGLVEGGEVIGVVSHCSTNCSPQQNIATRVDLPAFVAARINICSGVGLENDDCEDAIPFNDGLGDGVIPYVTLGATTDGPNNPSGQCNDFGETQTHQDIWYTYQSTCGGELTISTCDDVHQSGEPDYDTDLVVYGPYSSLGQINCNSLQFLACNDDDVVNNCGDTIYSSTINVNVSQGDYFLIRVGGWSDGDQGTGLLSVQCAGVSSGACCLPDFTCIEVTADQCAAQGGDYQGDGSDCADANCGPPTGACCLQNGDCIEVSAGQCASQGGDYQGDGSDCADVNCPDPTGACCLMNGDCVIITAEQCSLQSGDYQGDNTNCNDANCPQPTGACCLPNGDCVPTTEDKCNGAGGDYRGDGSNCDNEDCPQPTGACCLQNGDCVEVDAVTCKASGGQYFGNNTMCADVDCEQPTGACCLTNGDCVQLEAGDCAAQGGDYQGDGSDCFDAECPQPCDDSCPGDIFPKGDPCDGDGTINVDDLLKLLGQWGSCQDCNADIFPVGAPDGQVNVDDLLLLLAGWGDCDPQFTCDVGFTCGDDLVACEGSNNENCFCFNAFDGGTTCADITISTCEDLTPCPNGECPEGFACLVDTCCVDPICVAACTSSAGSSPEDEHHAPGTMTIQGAVHSAR